MRVESCTYDAVVLAAHNVGGTGALAHTDDRDWRALQAHERVEAVDDDTEQTEQRVEGRVGCLQNPNVKR